ncbi:MAG TPA: hypothetical protein DDX85_02375 [Nitrospiraceae bacterium]|nr:hypothetical protein [Nitrospiraceae bacterium]
MINKKLLAELKELHEHRGVITKSQIEYSRTEIRALQDIHPLIKPAEEIRHSHCRTLESYISVSVPSIDTNEEAASPF